MTTLVLATHNAHKVDELRRILGDRLGGHELVGYDGPTPVEDGATFEENALIKARAAHRHTGLPALADDSGICVDALGGAPGIHSAYYSGTRDDGENLRRLLADLGDSPDRTARFVCAAAFVDDSGDEVVRAEWPGTVLRAPDGDGGFGYDPIFLPTGQPVSAARLTPEQKDALSHRAQAFLALAERIATRYR